MISDIFEIDDDIKEYIEECIRLRSLMKSSSTFEKMFYLNELKNYQGDLLIQMTDQYEIVNIISLMCRNKNFMDCIMHESIVNNLPKMLNVVINRIIEGEKYILNTDNKSDYNMGDYISGIMHILVTLYVNNVKCLRQMKLDKQNFKYENMELFFSKIIDYMPAKNDIENERFSNVNKSTEDTDKSTENEFDEDADNTCKSNSVENKRFSSDGEINDSDDSSDSSDSDDSSNSSDSDDSSNSSDSDDFSNLEIGIEEDDDFSDSDNRICGTCLRELSCKNDESIDNITDSEEIEIETETEDEGMYIDVTTDMITEIICFFSDLEIEEEFKCDVPDEFLDPLTYFPIDDPVILPFENNGGDTETIFMEKSTLIKHLLNKEENPFTRSRLTIEELELYNKKEDSLTKIENYKKMFDKWKQENKL